MSKHQPTIATHHHAAFTLVEYLVVIVVIVLIIWILLPASGDRGPSLRVVDMSNLRQVAVFYLAYAEDHEGQLPLHPRDAKQYFDEGSHDTRDVWINPYQDDDEVIDRGDGDDLAVRYGGYVFINLGLNLEEVEKPDELILAYTAKITPDQLVRNVAFADGHVESWEEDQLRSSLPEDIDVESLDGP